MVSDMENVIYFPEWFHTDPMGKIYNLYYVPSTRKWWVSYWSYELTFTEVCVLCKIPDDEAIMLRLRYDGSVLQATA